MKKGFCAIENRGMFSFNTVDGGHIELWFYETTLFQFKEKENGMYSLEREGMYLIVPKADFDKLTIVKEN